MNRIVIGHVVVAAVEVKTGRGYECAAWWRETVVSPGEYPIVAEVQGGQVVDHSVSIMYRGVEGRSCFDTLWCGNLVKDNRDKDVGRPSEHRESCYAHALAKAILEGTRLDVVLDGFEAREVPFEYDGKALTTWGIFKVQESPAEVMA